MDARDRVTTMADNIPSGGSGSDAMDRLRVAIENHQIALHPGAAGVLEVTPLTRLTVPIGASMTQRSSHDLEGKPAMSKWLSPQKMLDYHIVRRFEDVAEAERQLYLAVVRGDVRARLNGKILGPEWLKQLCRMKISEASSFALPRDIELAAEDAPRV